MLSKELFTFVVIFCSVESFSFPTTKTQTDLEDDSPPVGSPLYLTPLLQRGLYRRAQQLSRVTPDIGNTTSYSGYFTVDKKCNSNIFFWFFPAQKANWTEAPLLLWLQGGPGISSLYGLFTELGPFEYYEDELKKRQFSWNLENNLLFIDQPVGTGYSFTEKGCYPQNETAVAADLYEAVVQFHQLFPIFQNNKFVIAGESYAGHFVPALGYAIYKNNPSAIVKINLVTMMIGNGWMDPVTQIDYGNYLYQLGLIDDSAKEVFKSYQDLFLRQLESQHFDEAKLTRDYIIKKLIIEFLGNVNFYNFLDHSSDLDFKWAKFIQKPEIRKALRTGEIPFVGNSKVVNDNLKLDIIHSVKPWVEELLEKYPIVFFNGQLDISCGYPMMINFLRSLSWKGEAEYLNSTRTQWCVGNELAGYYKGTHNLYDVLVRAAGHMVPTDQSLWAYILVNSVTSGTPDNPLHALTAC